MVCFVFAFFPRTMLHHNKQASMYQHARQAIGEDTLFCRNTHWFFRKHIVYPEDTLSLPKKHCFSRRYIAFREDYVFREDHIVFREYYIIVGEDYINFREEFSAKTIFLSTKTIVFSAKTIIISHWMRMLSPPESNVVKTVRTPTA